MHTLLSPSFKTGNDQAEDMQPSGTATADGGWTQVSRGM